MPVTENIIISRPGLMFLRYLYSNCEAKEPEDYEQGDSDTVPVEVINGFKHHRDIIDPISRKEGRFHNCDLLIYRWSPDCQKGVCILYPLIYYEMGLLDDSLRNAE